MISLVPRPYPFTRRNGLVNRVKFLGRVHAFATLQPSNVRDVQDCQQRLSSIFDLLLIFLCSLIQTLTLTPPPNNALLATLDMYKQCSEFFSTAKVRTLDWRWTNFAFVREVPCNDYWSRNFIVFTAFEIRCHSPDHFSLGCAHGLGTRLVVDSLVKQRRWTVCG